MLVDMRPPDTVWLYYHQGADVVSERSQNIFQRTLLDEEYVKLIDARTGEIVLISASHLEQSPGFFTPLICIKLSRTIQIGARYDKVKIEYGFSNDGRGPELTLLNFQVPKEAQKKGLGTQMFAAQVVSAHAFGFDHIVAYAAGGKVVQTPEKNSLVRYLLNSGISFREEEDKQNGYYTWPRLGFDKRLTPKEKEHLPPQFAHFTNLSDLMEDPGGRDWWRENGFALEVTFDTSPQSRSMRTLEAALLKQKDGYWESEPDMPLRIERGVYLRPRRDWRDRIWKYRQR